MPVQQLVIAFPELNESVISRIQLFRKKYDPLYPIVGPHFTLVFPIEETDPTGFSNEINNQVGQFPTISFTLKKVTVVKDVLSDKFHVFLIPETGRAEIIGLHDKLYGNMLQPFLRSDIEYIPHITIGAVYTLAESLEIINEWNAEAEEIEGIIRTIEIAEFDQQSVVTLEKISLL